MFKLSLANSYGACISPQMQQIHIKNQALTLDFAESCIKRGFYPVYLFVSNLRRYNYKIRYLGAYKFVSIGFVSKLFNTLILLCKVCIPTT
jgi:hypothetical protein